MDVLLRDEEVRQLLRGRFKNSIRFLSRIFHIKKRLSQKLSLVFAFLEVDQQSCCDGSY